MCGDIENIRAYNIYQNVVANTPFQINLYVGFDVDEIVIKDFTAVRAGGSGIALLQAPSLIQFDSGTLFSFPGATGFAYGYINKRFACASKNVNGSFQFIVAKAGGAAPDWAGELAFNIEFIRYKRPAIAEKANALP